MNPIIKNKKLLLHADEFYARFGIRLHKFMSPLFGFDVVKFDELFLKTPDGESCKEYCDKKYGADAVILLCKLL